MSLHEQQNENLDGRELLVGVSGGIAAFKTAALVSQLAQSGAGVTVVMTENATRFVGPATFEALTGRGVVTSLFGDPRYPLGAHVQLAERGDLLVIAPATANFLAQAAHGQASDALSTLYFAFPGPKILAPAMNSAMWRHPAVARNCDQVADDGARVIAPGEGWLSCRTEGAGRMAEPAGIHRAILDHFAAIGTA